MMRPRAMSASSSVSTSQDRKTVPCRHWVSKGRCDLGSDCKFSHDTPSTFQRRLCKNFSATGKCPHGSGCHYLHSGWPGMASGSGRPDNQKTVLCKNWMETGSCNYGDKCSYAHGEEEIRSSKEKRIIANNPLYKTTLCKMFAEGEYCELAENCHFAHGEDELRAFKPPDKSDQASSDPLYKTQICNNWETEEGCEYGEGCRFAHGSDELRILKPSDLIAAGVWNSPSSKMISPQYKTEMCNKPDCRFGSSCNFAHSPAEMRTVQQNLAEINPNYKGTLCKYYMGNGECEFGNICQYAHGESELRRISQGPSNRNFNQNLGGSSFNSLQYKTQLCNNYQETGTCDFGAQCQLAHGMVELRSVSQYSPAPSRVPGHVSARELCMSWLQTGLCLAREDCGSAHSLNELSSHSSPRHHQMSSPVARKSLCKNFRETGQCPYGTNCQYSHNQFASPGGNGPKPIKVVMCQDYESGTCSRGETCSFAHGQQELQEYRSRQVPNYKTTLCQSYTRTGACQWGDTCMYAHGSRELRNKYVPGYGGSDCKRVKL